MEHHRMDQAARRKLQTLDTVYRTLEAFFSPGKQMASFFVPALNQRNIESQFAGCTLVVPAVSIGNVGQLATDLLLNAYGAQKVGYIYQPDNIAPMVCADALAARQEDVKGALTVSTEGLCAHFTQFPVLFSR